MTEMCGNITCDKFCMGDPEFNDHFKSQLRTYYDSMTTFYTIIAFFHIAVIAAIAVFFSLSICKKKRKTSLFQILMLCLIMVQQMLIAVDFLMYGRSANKYCMLVRYDIRSISYSVLLNSVLIVAYQYWYVANKIYKFTQKGILPKQRSKFRNKSILLLLSVVSIMTTIVFLTLLQVYVFFDNSLLMDGRRIDPTDFVRQ